MEFHSIDPWSFGSNSHWNSLILDSAPQGHIVPSQRLRQGDPLSPFLSILGSEALSQLLTKAKLRGDLYGILVSINTLPISHLVFADDLIIFAKASKSAVRAIDSLLELYSSSSGQSINRQKSSDRESALLWVGFPSVFLNLEGDLGFKSMQHLNQALLSKHDAYPTVEFFHRVHPQPKRSQSLEWNSCIYP